MQTHINAWIGGSAVTAEPAPKGTIVETLHVAVGGVLVVTTTAVTAAAALCLAVPVLRQVVTRVHRSGASALPLDELLAGLFAAVLVGCLAWLALVVTATLTEIVTGRGHRLVRAATPVFVRRGVAVACGVALTGSALTGTATAATEESWPEAVDRDTVQGLVLPDRVPGALLDTDLSTPARPRSAPAQQSRRSDDSSVRLVVRPRDSLWSIATGLMPRGVSTAEVDRSWRALYHANRARVGEDPDHLLPGTTLTVPHTLIDRKDAP